MADFFSRVAERALGLAPTVKPNLPPMFAPAPMIETAAEALTSQFGQPADHWPSQGNAKRDHADRAATAQPPAVGQERQQQRSVSHEPPSPMESLEERREPGTLRPDAPVQKSQDEVRFTSLPARTATPSIEKLSPPRFDNAPTIQVTIGRVEVRAVTPPPETPRTVERKAPPLFSLEEYLRERNGRRR